MHRICALSAHLVGGLARHLPWKAHAYAFSVHLYTYTIHANVCALNIVGRRWFLFLLVLIWFFCVLRIISRFLLGHHIYVIKLYKVNFCRRCCCCCCCYFLSYSRQSLHRVCTSDKYSTILLLFNFFSIHYFKNFLMSHAHCHFI